MYKPSFSTFSTFLTFLTILTHSPETLSAQSTNPARFQSEVDQITRREFVRQPDKTLILFTGSSSIRLWTSLQEDYPRVQALNTGFGGSTMEELLYYSDQLIFPFAPSQIFIYEGDNDIALNQSMEQILKASTQLIAKIRERLPETEVVLIAAKPSIARWEMKDRYLELNAAYRELARQNKKVRYADIWKPMLGKDGTPKPELFIADQLHMNPKGYEIWYKVIRKLIRK